MLGAIAVSALAFTFWAWTWGKGIPYINQEPGQRWRDKARVAARNRSKMLDKASVAWKAGQKSTAKTLSERGKHFGSQVERYNERAAKEIFLSLNATYYTGSKESLEKIDLHGLFVNEALVYTQNHLNMCRDAGVTQTSIITGRGNNSKDGVAKIKPAVEGLLVREGLADTFQWVNEGCVAVTLPRASRRTFSTSSESSGCVVM
ncbi:Smr domain-containing protein C11H11,03c OS=Schizosaccharomyces pombe (strain 972 / ATCC 24843) GN=SPAC11H11.03c PE=4 SV=1 [Rhizoctonia solani AG-1 IB]|uniref:Smr domain-containing protein C11H11,03c n=1 Tax=Thanatephorus cucumeris (strain AG1-IB / isolate 7/3/14) TaxID=1108050 RepID=A0A0B7FLQ3_THACB|nr:Smr domain-containing protein C11H11,03c OS=Schizosaccharomyces pombe (strain 972 / ATCC 24843) GN=SPAC11H11.03c PE=4 SV=1 [Rhizoctonia solani AG-1 IB]